MTLKNIWQKCQTKEEKKQQQKYQHGIDSRWIDFVNKIDCFESYNLMVS